MINRLKPAVVNRVKIGIGFDQLATFGIACANVLTHKHLVGGQL